jgi:DNA polymerase I
VVNGEDGARLKNATERPTVVVIDGTSMLHRAFHSMGAIRSPAGLDVGATVGVANQITRLMQRSRAMHFAFVFDVSRQTFRTELAPSYKAHRPPLPEVLANQRLLVEEMVRAMGFVTMSEAGFEADDLMATLATQARQQDLNTWLVSPDKDLYQLVTDEEPSVKIYDTMKKRIMGEKRIFEKLGVSAAATIDYFAMVGDGADNIPGIRGVGPKAAATLLTAFGSMEGIYQNLDKIPGIPLRGAKGIVRKLQEGREDADLAKALVTLRHDVPLPAMTSLHDHLAWKGPTAEAEVFFKTLGYVRPLNDLHVAYHLRKAPR